MFIAKFWLGHLIARFGSGTPFDALSLKAS